MHVPLTYSISIFPFDRRPGRFRWIVSEGGKERDRSFNNFATKREAQADAEKFVRELIATWQKHY